MRLPASEPQPPPRCVHTPPPARVRLAPPPAAKGACRFIVQGGVSVQRGEGVSSASGRAGPAGEPGCTACQAVPLAWLYRLSQPGSSGENSFINATRLCRCGVHALSSWIHRSCTAAAPSPTSACRARLGLSDPQAPEHKICEGDLRPCCGHIPPLSRTHLGPWVKHCESDLRQCRGHLPPEPHAP